MAGKIVQTRLGVEYTRDEQRHGQTRQRYETGIKKEGRRGRKGRFCRSKLVGTGKMIAVYLVA